MTLLGSTKKDVDKDKDGGNVSKFRICWRFFSSL